MGGMVRLLATVGAAGLKALKNYKRANRRQKLGLPRETNKQIRTRLKKSKR